MGKRQFPWDMRPVPWSDLPEFTRGTWDGLILLSWGIGPRDRLATRRQLRAMGLRPGGQDPVAVLYFRHRAAHTMVFANLYLIERAKPVRAMTPAKRAAVAKAMAARRTCRVCGEQGPAELPRATRVCEPCRFESGDVEPWDYLHDYVRGTPTLSPAEHAALDAAAGAAGLARVIPMQRTGRTEDGGWRDEGVA